MKSKSAKTLSWVLIVLGIVMIIAAMVLLPTAYSYLYYRRHRGEEE